MNAKQKRSITARSTQANPPNAVQKQLEVAIPAATIKNSSSEITGQSQAAMSQGLEGSGEHSTEPSLTPTSVINLLEDDDGPHTLEGVATPETEKTEQDEQTQRERRASLDDIREGSSQQRERHNRQLHDSTYFNNPTGAVHAINGSEVRVLYFPLRKVD